MNWYDARNYSYNKYLSGRMGWRLPTIEELASLVDPGEGPPTLPAGHPFINVPSRCWSSSSYDSTNAWYVNFNEGLVSPHDKFQIGDFYVWCVRGGQGYDAY
jgi:hypothetical protein